MLRRHVGRLIGASLRGNSRIRGLRAFFAKAKLRHADVQHIKIGTRLMQAEEALSDTKTLNFLLHSGNVKKTSPQFVRQQIETMPIGPKSQRKRVAQRVIGLRKKMGSKESRRLLKKVALNFKKTKQYQGMSADDISDLVLTRKRRK